MSMNARATVSIITLVSLWTVVVFSLYTIRVAAQDEAGWISYARCEGTGGFVPLECFRGSEKLADAYASPGLSVFLNKLFLGAMSLGAVLAVLRLAWAGFQYMASDLWANKQHAKDIIQETLLGLFILLGISLILNQINPDILKLNVNITKLPPTAPAAPTTPATNSYNATYPPAQGFTAPNNAPPPKRGPPLAPGSSQNYNDGREIPYGAWCNYRALDSFNYFECFGTSDDCGKATQKPADNGSTVVLSCREESSFPDTPDNLPDTTPADCTVSGNCPTD